MGSITGCCGAGVVGWGTAFVWMTSSTQLVSVWAGGCEKGGTHGGFRLEKQGLVLLKPHGNNWSCECSLFTASSVTHETLLLCGVLG